MGFWDLRSCSLLLSDIPIKSGILRWMNDFEDAHIALKGVRGALPGGNLEVALGCNTAIRCNHKFQCTYIFYLWKNCKLLFRRGVRPQLALHEDVRRVSGRTVQAPRTPSAVHTSHSPSALVIRARGRPTPPSPSSLLQKPAWNALLLQLRLIHPSSVLLWCLLVQIYAIILH